MVHLKTRATRRDPDGRLHWKIELIRHLYERGFRDHDVEQLFRFIDWVMMLPEELGERFDDELRRIEGETGMRYVTRFEQRAIDRGREEGLQLGRQEGRQEGRRQGRQEGRRQGRQEGIQLGELSVLKRQIARRFESVPAWAEHRLQQASPGELELWAERIIDVESLEDVFAKS